MRLVHYDNPQRMFNQSNQLVAKTAKERPNRVRYRVTYIFDGIRQRSSVIMCLVNKVVCLLLPTRTCPADKQRLTLRKRLCCLVETGASSPCVPVPCASWPFTTTFSPGEGRVRLSPFKAPRAIVPKARRSTHEPPINVICKLRTCFSPSKLRTGAWVSKNLVNKSCHE